MWIVFRLFHAHVLLGGYDKRLHLSFLKFLPTYKNMYIRTYTRRELKLIEPRNAVLSRANKTTKPSKGDTTPPSPPPSLLLRPPVSWSRCRTPLHYQSNLTDQGHRTFYVLPTGGAGGSSWR